MSRPVSISTALRVLMCRFRSFASPVAIAMMVVRSDGYDVWYWSLVGYTMNMQILVNSITSHGVFSPAVWLRLSWMVVSSELANSPCSRLQKQKSSAPLRDHRCGQVTWQVLPLLRSSHLAGTGHMGSGSGEGVPLDLLPALYLSVDAPLLVQSSSATLPNLSRPQLWSSHLAGAHERQAFDHRCGRVAKLALERRRVQQRCPRGFSSAALGHRPQNQAKGADPRTGTPQKRNVFLPGCSVFSLSWPACAGAFLVPGLWFSGPAPSVSCLFCSARCFFLLAAGVTFQLPAGGTSGQAQKGHRPKNRYRAPTQGPAFSGISLRTTLLCTSSRLSCSFPSALLFYLRWSWNFFPCILHCYNSDC